MALVIANELLTDNGATAVIQADLREPEAVLNRPQLRALITSPSRSGALSHIRRDKLPPKLVETGLEVYQRRQVTGSPMSRHALMPERFRGRPPGYLAPGRLNVLTR
jgi:hypothetical protein